MSSSDREQKSTGETNRDSRSGQVLERQIGTPKTDMSSRNTKAKDTRSNRERTGKPYVAPKTNMSYRDGEVPETQTEIQRQTSTGKTERDSRDSRAVETNMSSRDREVLQRETELLARQTWLQRQT